MQFLRRLRLPTPPPSPAPVVAADARSIPPAPPHPAVETALAANDTKVADYWSEVLGKERGQFSPDVFWLAVPEVARRFASKGVGEKYGQYASWIDYCVGEFPKNSAPVAHLLSIGCGNGDLERHLHRIDAFQACDAYDIAPGVIATAKKRAAEAGITTINYGVQDVTQMELPTAYYDSVWFNMSLHHIEPLEKICEQVVKTLKPDGYLFFNEYIGPNRFDFTTRQKEVLGLINRLIPHRYLKLLRQEGYRTAPPIPDPKVVRATDPSESVRSADIMKVIPQYFDIVVYHEEGGTLLQYMLQDIAGNFRASDPDSQKVLAMLFQIEDTLIATGDLQSDFAVVVAQPKKAASL